MKKLIKNPILMFVLGAVIFGGVGTVLAYSYAASQIAYNPDNSAWKVNNVKDAIDSLYLSKTADNYSTDEQVVGTWIDGKPLYQKTFNAITPSSMSSQSWTDVSGVIIPNADYITIVNAVVYASWGKAILNYAGYLIHRIAPTGQYQLFSTDGSPSWQLNIPIIVTFQYTKTTDIATK